MFINQNIDKYNRKTENYIVAYIDLLGITNRINTLDKQELAMNKLHNLYTFSVNLTKDIQSKENQDIQFKIFSDNIIIAKKLSTDLKQKKRDIKCLLACAANFQETAASDSVGWMLRGGITIGKFFIDDVMVWGEALVRAYYLEDKVANYPRIIIDDNVIKIIGKDNELKKYLRKDFDNLFFLNYLVDCYFCGEILMNGFECMKKEIGEKMNLKTLQKFAWHMNYINSELDKKNQKQDKKFRLKL